jgi:hypothetical protein
MVASFSAASEIAIVGVTAARPSTSSRETLALQLNHYAR